MRVSTGMIFDTNITALNTKTASLLNTQQQLSSGKRILTPADDPVGASQVLQLTQSAAVNNQYQAAQTSAQSSLGIIDTQMSAATNLITSIQSQVVKAGNASLSDADRQSIATQLRSDYTQLLGIANSTDGNGQYLFSGYQGSNIPFSGSVGSGVTYAGDDGQRAVRVSGSQMVPVSVSGNDIFMNIKNGNGTFVTGTQTQRSTNTGSAAIDAGTVSNPVKWTASGTPANINVNFWTDTTNALGGGAGAQYYDLVDASTGNSLFTGAPSATGAGGSYSHPYSSGASIPLSSVGPPAFDFGASVKVSGTPASGDGFVIASSNSSSGNGYFTTSPLMTAASNTGTGVINVGSVSNPSNWNSSANSGQLDVRFWQDPATSTMYYDLVDRTTGKSLFTNTSSTTGGAGNTYTHAYTSGNAISFSGLAAPYNDFGASVTITGTPVGGDSFSVNRSASTSVFSMLGDMINALETPSSPGTPGNTQLQNTLSTALTNFTQVQNNVSQVRSVIGASMNQVTALTTTSQGLDTQYQGQISNLQNVDYNKAVSDLTRSQTELQATQQSFAKIAGLSLFNYL